MRTGLGLRQSAVRRAATAAAALAVLAIAAPGAPRAEDAPAPVVNVGQGLEIAPHRLVLGAGGGQAKLDVRLPGAAARFGVQVEDRVMLEDGRILSPSDPEAAGPARALRSARDLVRAAPDILGLAAGAPQQVTVSVAPATALPAGDYRVHVIISAERPAAPAPGKGPQPRYNLWDYAVPVIVRVGPVDARAGFSDFLIVRQSIVENGSRRAVTVPILQTRLQRLGRTSLFGDVIVTDGPDLLGRADGVGVYPEIESRRVQIPLIRTPAPGDRLTVVFIDRDARPGEILAQVSGVLSSPSRRPA